MKYFKAHTAVDSTAFIKRKQAKRYAIDKKRYTCSLDVLLMTYFTRLEPKASNHHYKSGVK